MALSSVCNSFSLLLIGDELSKFSLLCSKKVFEFNKLLRKSLPPPDDMLLRQSEISVLVVIPAKAGIQELRGQFFVQILPKRVIVINQFQLPFAIPFLYLLFPADGRLRGFMHLIPNQTVSPVFLAETFNKIILVLVNPL
jgi:hypothetical protein